MRMFTSWRFFYHLYAKPTTFHCLEWTWASETRRNNKKDRNEAVEQNRLKERQQADSRTKRYVNRTIIRWTWRCNLVPKLSSSRIRPEHSASLFCCLSRGPRSCYTLINFIYKLRVITYKWTFGSICNFFERISNCSVGDISMVILDITRCCNDRKI